MPYKIADSAYANFTGNIGQVNFLDGVTVGEYPEAFIDRLSVNFGLIDVDTGLPVGLVARANAQTAVPFVPPASLDQMSDEQIAAANAAAVAVANAVKKAAASARPTSSYTQAELEEVASAKGIAGLREIAVPYGVRDKSINGLITAIMAAQQAVDAAQPKVVASAPAVAPEAPAAAPSTAHAFASTSHVVERNGTVED